MEDLRYSRIVVKISGESLGSGQALDPARLRDVALSLAAVHTMGVSVVAVVGGGNIFRGDRGAAWQLERGRADTVGMLATGINAMLLEGLLNGLDVPTRVFSRGPCTGIGQQYRRDDVVEALESGDTVLLAGGMGVSGFSTDVPAVHAAIDTAADAVVMVKFGVDGIYSADPAQDPEAVFLREVTASAALERNLRVMDAAALDLARQYGKPVHVVPASDMWSVKCVLEGKEIGSLLLPS
ncbi:amino acid kinase family protein [Plantactinospora endophytica]|uniref:Uridylate kinase n=1 Tax=Plantactinospora endophytica TaxID=673535 RepID=A0ABQ4E8I4_9ACTN|nr:UMP kinase [Plantactinospora endophytica]GIG91023.1 uridylate kinase [Plantactinospora endophytica]